MRGFTKSTLLCSFAFLLFSVSAFAQGANPAVRERGAYSVLAFGSGHDSSLGWTTVMNMTVGYDFSRSFSAEIGIPAYIIRRDSTATEPATTNNSIGDVYLSLGFQPQLSAFRYKTVLTGTAPTGDTSNGISTGRVTGTWYNRVEKDISRFTPFVEGSLSNSLSDTARYSRPYTTLGLVTFFTGGTGISLTPGVDIEVSAYTVLPIGDQKIYSRMVPHSAGMGSGPGSSMYGRRFEENAVSVGDSSLTKEHGFSGGLYFRPVRRVNVGVNYTRSITYHLDTISAGVNFRFGHMPQRNVED